MRHDHDGDRTLSVQWRYELHVRIAVGMMSHEEMDAETERLHRECRDADEHLRQLMVNLDCAAKLLGELSGRIDRQKNTAAVDWSGHYDKVMVEAGKSAETIDLAPYRAVLDIEALNTLQTEIAAARIRLFTLRGKLNQAAVQAPAAK
jgi:hypothetical protein